MTLFTDQIHFFHLVFLKLNPGQTAGLNFNTRATTSLTLSSQVLQIPIQVRERRNWGGRVFSHTRHTQLILHHLVDRSIPQICSQRTQPGHRCDL